LNVIIVVNLIYIIKYVQCKYIILRIRSQ